MDFVPISLPIEEPLWQNEREKKDLEKEHGYGYKRRIDKVAPLPWHGRSTYGGLKNGLWTSPSELCTEEVAIELLNKASKSVDKASGFIREFFK